MSTRTLLMMAALLLGAFASPAAVGKQKQPKSHEAGVWQIHADPAPENGCYATRVFRSGTAMLINPRPDGSFYLGMGRSSWQFAKAGKTYRMKFEFGNGRTYEEDFDAVAVDAGTVLVSPAMSDAFLSDFTEKTSLHISYRGTPVATVLLFDTYEAVTRLKLCNASRRGAFDASNPSLR